MKRAQVLMHRAGTAASNGAPIGAGMADAMPAHSGLDSDPQCERGEPVGNGRLYGPPSQTRTESDRVGPTP